MIWKPLTLALSPKGRGNGNLLPLPSGERMGVRVYLLPLPSGERVGVRVYLLPLPFVSAVARRMHVKEEGVKVQKVTRAN
jgi:hypothetical protein